MANPPITIGSITNVPAPGSPIRSPWPQTISHIVTAESHVDVNVNGSDASPIDANTSASFVNWLTLATPTPPSWATSIWVDVMGLGLVGIVGDADMFFRVVCNSAGVAWAHSAILNKYGAVRFGGVFPAAPGGGNPVIVQARRAGGTGSVRYAGTSALIGTIKMQP